MTPKTFTEAPIWQEASLKPREGQRFFVRHRKNEDRPGNYIEVVWEGTETSGGYRHAILLTQTGERLVWEFNDVCYRTHRQIKAAETITLPRELNSQQIQAVSGRIHSAMQQGGIVLGDLTQKIWADIKQHGGK